MKQVVDHRGDKVVGLFKKEDGSLVVSNKVAFEKSVLEKKRVDEVLELHERIDRLENIIQKLLSDSIK